MTSYRSLMEEFLSEMPSRLSDKSASKAAAEARAKGLVYKGGSPATWGPEDGQATMITRGDKLVPIEKPEEKPQQDEPKKPDTQPAQNPGQPAKKIPLNKVPNRERVPETSLSKDQFDVALSKLLDMSLAKFKNSSNLASLAPELTNDFKAFYGQLDVINKLPAGEKRRTRLEDLISSYNISIGKSKIYANKFSSTGGLRKVFGGEFNKASDYFLELCDAEGIQVPLSTDEKSNAKAYLSGRSKPNYGRPHRILDTNVQELFNSDPVLNRLDPRYKSVYGPTGPNGLLLQSGGENAKAYFDHSVNANRSVQNTIDALTELSVGSSESPSDTRGYVGVANALRDYQQNMKSVLDNFDHMTPRSRSELVGHIYSKLAVSMYEASPDVANSIMKNMAEIALYDTELAEGQEVYLPSESNFPTGDKIVVTRDGTKVENIKAISVKYGKNSSESFGLPSQASKLCMYHPDPQYKDLIDYRAGRTGYETGVNGTIIHDEANFRTMARHSGFDQVFEEDKLERLRELGVKMTLTTKRFKRERFPNKKEISPELMGGIELDDEMNVLWKQLEQTIASVDQQKLQSLLGDFNYRQITKSGKNAMIVYSMMVLTAAIKTSNGFPAILHNHQSYERGNFISQTEQGTPNIPDWKMTWIPYGARAGGLKAGFNVEPTE